jgi:hypothetical protein
MMALIGTLVIALLAAGGPQADPVRCVDPATPFRELALTYDWPPAPSERTAKAFGLLKDYLRSGEAGDYREAVAEYKWLAASHRNDPHINLALGVLYAAGPDLNFHGAERYRHNAVANNSNADDLAARSLGAVLAADSSVWLAAVALTRIALVTPEPDRMDMAVSATASLLRRDSSNITARLLWHDLLVARELWPEAKQFATSFGMPCTAMKHAMAEALLLTGDTAAGVRLYLAALDSAQPDELYRFYDDIRVMATVGQLADYEAALPEERPQWIRALWNYSATSFARSLETRIAEHVARATYADIHFRATEFAVATQSEVGWISDTTHLVPWDARGVLYVRHGAPLHRFAVRDQCSEPYESWVYTADDGPSIFWFSRNCVSPDGLAPRHADWQPIFAPPSCGRPFLTRPVPTLASALMKLRTAPDSLDRRDIYTLLSQYDDRYSDILRECAKIPMGGATLALRRMMPILNREGLARFREAEWSESSFPQIETRVRIATAAYQFRDAQQGPELAALAWIPAADLRGGTSPATDIRLSFILATPPVTAVRRDTTVAVSGARVGVLYGAATIPVAEPGASTLRVLALDAADTTRGGVRALPVTVRGDAGRLAVSDIVLGTPGSDGELRRGQHAIAPLPGHRITSGQDIRLYAEIYGAMEGEEATVTVRVRRVDNGALARLRSLFPGRVAERTLTFKRQIDLDTRGVMAEDVVVSGDLLPGDYAVELAVVMKYGEIVVRETALHVAEPGENATLTP